MSHKVHGEVEYQREDKDGKYMVHSDICPPNCDLNNLSDEYRQYLHASLDEWLNESRGTGIFYITGDSDQFLRGPTHLDLREETLNNRIDRLEAEIDQLKQQLASNARDHGVGGFWRKN